MLKGMDVLKKKKYAKLVNNIRHLATFFEYKCDVTNTKPNLDATYV